MDRGDCKISELTIREYMAAMALQGFLAKSGAIEGNEIPAVHAVNMADGLIEALDRIGKLRTGGDLPPGK